MSSLDSTLYSGITSLRITGLSQASGTLLWTGRHIITAAHFTDDITNIEQLEIEFNSNQSIAPIEISNIYTHPGWDNDPDNYNHDIAIIELSTAVDLSIERYQIYRNFDEVGQSIIRSGYSQSIDPETGLSTGINKDFHTGANQYDTTTDAMNSLLGSSIINGSQLTYDFDNGSSENDAYGQILGLSDTGTGLTESFNSSGDSGGASFINNQIAGISSYIFRYETAQVNPDITQQTDSTYGEMASDTRVSKYTNWIDSIVLGDEYIQEKPTQSEAVDLYPVEGDINNTFNYFLLEIGCAYDFDTTMHYQSLDGTAMSGPDYIYTSGVTIIPAGQTYIAIEVEIIADLLAEDDETFGIRVYEPQGVSFPEGTTELTAFHTIIDNDLI